MGVLVHCMSAAEAVRRALGEQFAATAIAVRSRSSGDMIELGTLTPFGPVVRHWADASAKLIDSIVSDTVRAAGKVYLFSVRDEVGSLSPFDLEGAVFDAFLAARPLAPVIESEDGGYATWWSIAAAPEGSDFGIGDVLTLHEEREGGAVALRYRGRDGRDAGLHALLARELAESERSIVKGTEAVVQRLAYGVGLDDAGGRFRTQTLILRIPAELARSFADGKLPLLRPNARPLELSHV